MSENYIKNVVEAALLAAGRPLQLNEIAELFEEHSRPEPDALRAALEGLGVDYNDRGIELKETATGFRIQVRKEMANEVSRLWPERPPKYSRALLETLALIAYRQPITRAEIEAVRGVAVNPNIIKTVIERNWVRVVGTRDVPGRPELLGTTKEFLDYFGLRALDELPPLAELKAVGELNLQLDLAKPTDPGSDDGSSGSGGANGAGEGGSASGAPDDSSAAAASADTQNEAVASADANDDEAAGTSAAEAGIVAAVGVAAVVADGEEVASADDELADAGADDVAVIDADPVAIDEPVADALASSEMSSAALEDLGEVAAVETAAIDDEVVSESVVAAASDEVFVAYEHDPHAATITHVEMESDPGDVTVEVQALTFVEQQLEAEQLDAEERAKDASIETGEFEMSELGMTTKPALVIEAEFEVDDLGGPQADEDDVADDDEELSAGPQSSTELVAAPRDRDD